MEDNPQEIDARRRLIAEAKARKLQAGSVQESLTVAELDAIVEPIPCARTRNGYRYRSRPTPREARDSDVIAYRLTVERVKGPVETVVLCACSPSHAENYALRSGNRLRVLASEPVTLAEYRAEFGPDRVNRWRGGRPRAQAPESFWS